MKRIFSAGSLLGVLMLTLCAPPAEAGAFSVVPVRLQFGPRDRSVAVTLANQGNAPIALQAELYAWQQRPDGTDQLAVTDDLILAPPIIRLAPQAQQVVRLALLRPADPQRQLTYRMIVRELPELSSTTPDTVSVPVALALSLPVFITPAMAQREVSCAVERAEAGVQARCENKGNAHALVREAALKQGDAVVARFEGGAYLLPGASRPIALKGSIAVATDSMRLVVTYDDDRQEEFTVDAQHLH
jgi:fimbrial chaperone protein